MIRNEIVQQAFEMGYRVNDEGQLISPKGKARKLRQNSKGYLETNVRIGGKLCHLYIHQLVAYQKYGDGIYGAECVRHIDGNPQNNTIENIRIGTQSQNMRDIPCSERKKNAEHATSFVRKWDKKVIREYHENHSHSYKETMNHFGITSKGALWFILNK